MTADDVIERLRSALVIQCPANSYGMQRGELCWCHPDYDAERYGHSVACAAAKEAIEMVKEFAR